MSRTSNSKCEICRRQFYRRPAELKKANHLCCRGCRSKLYKSQKNYYGAGLRMGSGWNKGMSKAKGDILSYGKPRTQKTKNAISKKLKEVLSKNGTDKKCIYCNKLFYDYPNGNRILCSKKCESKYRMTGDIRECPACKKQFYKSKKLFKVCCSKKCALTYRGKTNIEKILDEWLTNKGIPHEYNKEILLPTSHTYPDFFILPNICLYADGDYWHNLPKNKQQDKWVNKGLEMLHYKVIRLTESEIKRGVRPCL